MRMTNKIMRNNAAYNINQNKILQDKLTNQMTNQSKIARPSDDPVVAIRALRLRSNVTMSTQYNEKNAEDAKQWLTLTADAMTTVDEVLNDLYKQATSAPNKFETADDLRIYLTQMKQLTSEFYSTANVDYAGRYVFSGYRTDLPITFTAEDMKEMKKHPISYNINESFGYQDISRISYTDYNKIRDGLAGPGTPTTPGDINDENSYEQAVSNDTLYRFRISYNNTDSLNGKDVEGNPKKLTITLPEYKDTTGKVYNNVEMEITMPAGATAGANGGLQATVNVVSAVDPATGDKLTATSNPPITSVTMALDVQEFGDQEEAYKAISEGTCKGIAFVPTSGEMVFSKDFYEANFSEAAFGGQNSFKVNYDKSEWKEGDINPVHYFNCTETLRTTGPDVALADAEYRKTAYNTQREEGRTQDIYYDVGYNQQIQVNTRADEIFTHDVQRDMDDFDHFLKQLEDIETLEKNLKEEQAKWPEDSKEYKDYAKRLEGVDKAWTYIRDNVHTKFENQITKYQKYMDDSRVAMTDNATRGSRLELIKTRLTNQQATYKELQQDNEGIDITEVAIEMTSADLTYNAALMATGKIMQTNLMNYI